MNAKYDFQKHRKIYSVVAPSFRFEHTKLTVDDFLAISHMENDRNPKTICIQEFSKLFDSRRSGREENRLLSSVTGQSGKRNVDILYDDQFPTRIDKGMRDVTDLTILCESILDEKKMPIAFRYTWFEGFLLYPTGQSYVLPEIFMKQFYNDYDTYEITKPLMGKKKDD